MRQQDIDQHIRVKGYSELINSIRASYRDLKQAGYTNDEIKETLVDVFGMKYKKIANEINRLTA